LDLATSVNKVLSLQGRRQLPNETIYGYIGNGVRHLIERSLGEATPSEVDRTLEMFAPIYKNHLLDTTRPYDGVRTALEALQGQATLAVLSNKPYPMSVACLEGLKLASYFQFVFGGDSFPNRKPDPIGIETLLNETGAVRDKALMVGDSRVDYETARNAFIPICMVSYGLGASEIDTLEPDYVVDDLRKLIPIVEG
jgi:phosphoglycolate phosphatase